MEIEWLDEAIDDLEKQMEYYAQDDIDMALKFYARVRRRVEELADFPNLGRPGQIFGTRELVIAPYPHIVPYTVEDNTIIILRVFHVSRELPEQW
jgi:plasmid stabilization system protein ParE